MQDLNKMKFQTADQVANVRAKLAELFPTVVAEGKVNLQLLQTMLGEEVFGDEAYEFTWVGKRAAIAEAAKPIRKTLRPSLEDSKDWNNTENLYIEGDNLDVLKLLQESYLGKVKMVYIDPPYNTGKDFIYKDDFTQQNEDYEEDLNINDGDERLYRNTKNRGRFHSSWCSMIYSRLMLARNILKDDGVIFISINDSEIDNLRKICNEVFNENNHLGTLVLETATDNNPQQINTEHEYIVCYAKNKCKINHWQAESEKAKKIQERYIQLLSTIGNRPQEIQEELRKWIRLNKAELNGVSHYDNVDEKGVFHDGDIANTVYGGYAYDIIHPVSGKVCKVPEKGFRYAESTMREMISQGEILFGSDETILIKPKKRIENAKDVLRSVIYEDGRASTRRFEQLMARDIFQNPKSETVLSTIFNFVVEDNDIVLDFFAGSSTTAEAVMLINNKFNKKLRYILVQIPENLDQALISADARAKATLKNAIEFLDGINKAHTICEIGKERIRRAGDKIKAESPLTTTELDTGFRVFKLADTNMEEVYYTPAEYDQDLLMRMQENIKSDRTDLDILFACLLDWGLPLSMPHTHEQIDGFTVHTYNSGDLIACFEKKVSEVAIREIANRKPLRAVFRDSSFENSPQKINVFEIFKLIAPNTTVRVI